MKYEFQPAGTCSRRISFEVDDNGVIGDVSFTGGCNGNLQGIAALVKGRKAEDVIAVLKGIRCGNKMTSCPDQFACALTEIVGAK
ncbi:MAG: TIGR03905 family TSCPD domain-containing protein [Muribaculaceae bacterium]